MKEIEGLLDNAVQFFSSEPFQKWLEKYDDCATRFYHARSRSETLETILQRQLFHQNLYATQSQRVLERKFSLMEEAGALDEKESEHNKLLKRFEALRAESTRLWEKISTEQVKKDPSESKIAKLTQKYENTEAEKLEAESQLHVIWAQQGLTRLHRELLYWKAHRVQKASLRLSRKASAFNGRILRVRSMLEKEKERLKDAETAFNKIQRSLPQNWPCQLIENFVCFPMGNWGLLYALIDDDALFSVSIRKHKIYRVNLETGFESLEEIHTETKAA